jgi:methylmalonyl-CoA mutase
MVELAAGFQRFEAEDWRRAAGGIGAFSSEDGIPIGPIYPSGTGADTLWYRPESRWNIVATVTGTAVSTWRDQVRTEIEGGATGIELVFATSPSPLGHGSAEPIKDWGAVFGDLDLGDLTVRIDAGEETPKLAKSLIAFLKSRAGPRTLVLAFDPIATLAAQGRMATPRAAIGAEAAALSDTMAEAGTAGHVLIADGRLWHNAGASPAQELAIALGAVAEYLRLLESSGLTAERVIAAIGIALSADADQFLTIAKLRAMRLLHARLLAVAEISPVPCRIHAETSWRMLSRLDPHTNILRTTAAAASAGLGGADSVTALPFDAADGGGDQFARRIARNSQTIMIEEAGLARVADPGAGAGAVEALTVALAEKAWERFRQIERESGLHAAVLSGSIQRVLGEAQRARGERLARNEIPIVGANVFPDPAAKKPPAAQAQTRTTMAVEPALRAEPLQFMRLTEAIEARA